MKNYLLLFSLLLSFALSAQSTSQNCNCCTEAHKAFNFWVGTWDVTANGKPAGRNVIKKLQDDCVLQENWTSATPGYSGTSYNFYNTTTQQWEQLWIDNQGASLHLKGTRKGNQMILESDELTNKAGALYRNRVTWTANDDGTVRQLWEIISEGKVISVAFDGLYRRVQE